MFPQLDYILGGGLPFGRMVEIIGKNSSGKSTFAVAMTKVAQSLSIPVVWIDVEGTADPVRLAELGVDFTAGGIYMVEPPVVKGEKKALTVEVVSNKLEEIIKVFAETGAPFVIIWDSVAQTPAEKELEKGVGNQQPGIKAKVMAQFSQIIAPLMTNSQVLFLAINQARDEMGSMWGGIDSPGGHALHHWASLRLQIDKSNAIKAKEVNAYGGVTETYIGHNMRVTTLKSKVSRPQQKEIVYLLSDNGLNFEENTYRSCLAPNNQYGLISGGTWKKYTTLAGEEVKFNSDRDWVNYLQSEAGYPILEELFGRMMSISFPKGFAPYNNASVDIRKIPIYKDIENYREAYGVAPTATDDEATAPSDVENLLDQLNE